jgi:hypothetical protein
MSYNFNMSTSNAMADDNLVVVDKPNMSTQAIVFIALASASAAFTLGAGIWCLFYGAFGRGLRQRRARQGGRVCHFLFPYPYPYPYRVPSPHFSIRAPPPAQIPHALTYSNLSRPPRLLLKKHQPRPAEHPASASHGSHQNLDHHTRRPLPTCPQPPHVPLQSVH